MEKYHCEVCGKLFVLAKDYCGCSICNWMHDPVQEANPNYRRGANRCSLNEAKTELATKAATKESQVANVA